MKSILLAIYRKVKYTFFTTREKENFRFHKRAQPGLLSKYLQATRIRKIQIGAQGHSISGWLNADIEPKSREVMYLDATKPFPIESATFDYVYAEHMIEHIPFLDGVFMVKECFRILKPGGRIRLSTPDLAFLIHLYQSSKSKTQENYLEFSRDRYLTPETPAWDTHIINNFFRNWGHHFIYDEKTLKYILENSGFVNIVKCAVGESFDSNLRGIEQHGHEITDEYNRLESLIFEAEKF